MRFAVCLFAAFVDKRALDRDDRDPVEPNHIHNLVY